MVSLLFVVLVGVALGLVQGISEWLPISSKTQVLLASSILLGLSFSQGYALGLFLEGGTFLAAVYYFRNEIWSALLALVGKGTPEGMHLLKYIVVVTVVTGIIAVPLYLFVSKLVVGSVIGIPMIILGALLILDGLIIEFSKNKFSAQKDVQNMTILDFVFVGIAQGIAALPGISRSGATTSTMIFMKTRPDEAFRLSFFAGIPATVGASAVTVIFSKAQVSAALAAITLPGLAVAVVVSLGISLLMIKGLIKFAGTSRITTLVFALGILAVASGMASILFGVGG